MAGKQPSEAMSFVNKDNESPTSGTELSLIDGLSCAIKTEFFEVSEVAKKSRGYNIFIGNDTPSATRVETEDGQ